MITQPDHDIWVFGP